MAKTTIKKVQTKKPQDLLKTIDRLLAKSTACKFKTGKQLKRMDGDWDIRYDWKLYDANDKVIAESEWKGFATLPAALKDMVKHLEAFKND